MISPIAKLKPDALDDVAKLIFERSHYPNEIMPACKDAHDVVAFLQTEPSAWSVLLSDRPLAIFKLQTLEHEATLDDFTVLSESAIQRIGPVLLRDLKDRGLKNVVLNVSEELAPSLLNSGFQRTGVLLGFSIRAKETIFMPILPLTNPTQKDSPALAKLMFESYAKSPKINRLTNLPATERYLKTVTSGIRGKFLPDASFISITPGTGNVVSACLITSNSADTAVIAEIFTHPLYRTRGLATTEIQSAMNFLVKHGIHHLSVSIPEDHEAMRRLLSKLGMSESSRKVSVSKQIE